LLIAFELGESPSDDKEFAIMSLVSDTVTTSAEPAEWVMHPGKRVLDLTLAVPLLMLTAPVIFFTLLLVRLTSRGLPLYTQTRSGLGGRTYTMYKIRSMYVDCERLTGARWSTPNDPRVTPFGRFLRATHIDELPQLWNVIRGDMSLVGPRPERPEIIVGLELAIPYYRERLRVRPGVTGLAQVNLPPDTDLAGVERKLACDFYYAERASLGMDIRIMVATALGIFNVPARVSCMLLGLPGCDAVEPAYRERTDEMDTITQTAEPLAQANPA
jgi:lipopolysaccharide/colanic/teichoic acid biosynthesis glycosyltransferase